jgi:hypothetical protein
MREPVCLRLDCAENFRGAPPVCRDCFSSEVGERRERGMAQQSSGRTDLSVMTTLLANTADTSDGNPVPPPGQHVGVKC